MAVFISVYYIHQSSEYLHEKVIAKGMVSCVPLFYALLSPLSCCTYEKSIASI